MKTSKSLVISLLITIMVLSIPERSYSQGPGQYHNLTVIANDTIRHYLLYEPLDYTPGEEWPLVLAFHGFGSYPGEMAAKSQMWMVADTAKFFVVYPYGRPVEDIIWGETMAGWNVPGCYIAPQNDVLFTSRIIDDIIANPDFTIDTNRIYATGGSNGGEFAFYLACRLSDRIASFAGVIAQMSLMMMDSICTPGRTASVLQMLGTEDQYFPPEGNEWFPHLEGTSEYWAGIDNCDTIPDTTYLPDIDPGDSCTVTLLTYDSCYTSYEVLCYRIEGGIHTWPGGQYAGSIPGYNNDIDGSTEIWKFFLRNPHPRVYDFCLPEGVTFTTQQEIHDFPLHHPNCTEIEGDVVIKGNDITDLSGLSNVSYIGGNLEIGKDMAPWGGQGNANLTSLSGLDNLSALGGDLFIGFNESLPDLTGLEVLTSIGGNLSIVENNVLTSLYGIENIDSTSIQDLNIYHNDLLSYCHVASVCGYLSSPGGTVEIDSNASGCNNSTQVMDKCNEVFINEQQGIENFSITPNPTTGTLRLRYSISDPSTSLRTGSRYSIFELYTIHGLKVMTLLDQTQHAGEHEKTFDISHLPAGMYLLVMQAGQWRIVEKIVKH